MNRSDILRLKCNKELFVQLHINEYQSLKDIAEYCNISRSMVSKLFNEYNIPVTKRQLVKPDVYLKFNDCNWFIREINRKTPIDVAKDHNVSYQFVIKYCKMHNMYYDYNHSTLTKDIYNILSNKELLELIYSEYKSSTIIANHLGCSRDTVVNYLNKHTIKFITTHIHSSKWQNELYNNFKQKYEVINNYRDGLEIDLYFPDHNIGFECNGEYWHSNKFKPKDYHLNKIEYFKCKGIEVFHLWEWESQPYLRGYISDTLNNIVPKRSNRFVLNYDKFRLQPYLDLGYIVDSYDGVIEYNINKNTIYNSGQYTLIKRNFQNG